MNLDAQLAHLENAQLVRQLADEQAFIFKHALTQETVYRTLLKKSRRDIHRRVAETIEALYADRLDEYAARLEQHYAEAGDDAKTLAYATRAGDASAGVYANAEAVAHYALGIEAAKRLTGAMRESPLRELYLKRGRQLELASQFPAALANYAEMENLGRERGDRALELSALVAQSQILGTPNSEFNPALGASLAEKTLTLARALQDRAAEAKILWILVNLCRFTGRLTQAREMGEQSLKIARELNLREQMAYTLNDLTHAYSLGGQFKHARALIEEAQQLWRELKNLPMLADSLATASRDNNVVGRFDETIAFSEEAYQISQAIGNRWGQTYSLSNLGPAYWARGETARAIDTMEETLRLGESSGYPMPKVITRADLGVALASVGAFERGLEHVRGAIAFEAALFGSNRGMRPYPLSALVQIYLWMGNLAQAAATMAAEGGDQSIPFFSIYESLARMRLASAEADPARAWEVATRVVRQLDEFGMRSYIPEALFCQGAAELALGQTEAARASLLHARAEAEAIGTRWPLWQILGALGEVEAAGGNQSKAAKLFGEAHAGIAYLADHAPAELRDSFLKLPHVRHAEAQYVDT